MSSAFPGRPTTYNAPAPVSNAPQGTFLPGTKVQVGSHRVVIEKYLSEGGFAHVYVVKVPQTSNPSKYDTAVLKRVAVPDKDALANMRTEVETMKKLKGHNKIVTYIDSHASALKGGGYEVFLLMEYCQGGGLIDFMNTRLQHRLTEPEILKIFSDAAEGVACMHYLKPPLLHRDLKVENILIGTSGGSRVFKLCDFGSTAPPRPAATSAAEGRLIEEDVQRHTTMQYRSPEMVDVYRKLPIDEKSDIWALGVLLYKLCYYTTPFEDQGQMAILNASFKYPAHPSFSDRLKRLIGSMLREHPGKRPNIYQVIVEVCSMRGTTVPIKDIYANRTQSEDRRNQALPEREQIKSPPVAGIQKVAPVKQVQQLPEITPMRRGRPTAAQGTIAAKPGPSPMRGADPFAALDSTSAPIRAAAADELAARFPSLDEFSILHDKGSKFEFSSDSPKEAQQPEPLKQRVTSALADEAFAKPASPKPDVTKLSKVQSVPTRTASIKKEAPPITRTGQTPRIIQPSQTRNTMVSTGVGSSPPHSPKLKPKPPTKYPDVNARPIWRVPDASTKPARSPVRTDTTDSDPRRSAPSLNIDKDLPNRPALNARSRSSVLAIPQSPASSRPSLEGSRPSAQDLGDGINRSRSVNIRPRPTSMHLESNMDFLREQENASRHRPSLDARSRPPSFVGPSSSDKKERERDSVGVNPNLEIPEKSNITSDVDYLKAIEDHDSHHHHGHHKHRRSSSKSKRSSIPHIGLRGKFSDAFKKFETSHNSHSNSNAHSHPRDRESLDLDRPLRTPSPSPTRDRERERERTREILLTPIAGSEATDGRSEDGSALDETTELPPEVRRELERRALEAEERRVADAAAAYQARGGGKPVGNRGSAIQNRVKSFLDESSRPQVVHKTAEGYGKYTDANKPPKPPRPAQNPNMDIASRKPAGLAARQGQVPQQHIQSPPLVSASAPPTLPSNTGPQLSSTTIANQRPMPPRPSAPPKPKSLRTGSSIPGGPPSSNPNISSRPTVGLKPSALNPKPVLYEDANGQVTRDGEGNDEMWEEDFSKRYPSLSGLEMVEADIDGADMRGRGR